MNIACLMGNHVYLDEWTLRPAFVGADIAIEAIHFDRHCIRCKHLDSVWVGVEGTAQPETLRLSQWLEANDAAINVPVGTIRLPEGGTF